MIVGCINGFGVAIMKAPSLIFTLGVNGILRGLMFIYTDGADVNNIPKSFKDISAKALPGVRLTYYFIGALILTIIIHLILTNTRKGRYVKAVGDNADGAKSVGINRLQQNLFPILYVPLWHLSQEFYSQPYRYCHNIQW